jgi:hypothetical protein
MKPRRETDHRVVAIDPTSRGFGFAVLEDSTFLVDWGTKDVGRADDTKTLRHVRAIVLRYDPDAIVLEDPRDPSFRRSARVRNLIISIQELSVSAGKLVAFVARPRIHKLFGGSGAPTKRRIALILAEHFPELAPRVPPIRKAWMSEDARSSIFDAVAFALTYFFDKRDQNPPPHTHAHTPGTS